MYSSMIENIALRARNTTLIHILVLNSIMHIGVLANVGLPHLLVNGTIAP